MEQNRWPVLGVVHAFGCPDDTGDLYGTVEVDLPRSLTGEQRSLFEALRKLESGTKHSAA